MSTNRPVIANILQPLLPYLILGTMLCSCGYQLQGSSSILPDDVKFVAVLPVVNDTTESDLGPRLQEALELRFERYGVVHVVEEPNEADAVLEARIIDVHTQVRNVTGDTDIALEMELVMSIAAELRRSSGQLLWKNSRLMISDTFENVSDVVVTSSSAFAQSGLAADTFGDLGSREASRAQQEQAYENLLDEAARKIYLSAVAANF